MDPLAPIRELVARVATLESQLAAEKAENARLREENARLREENAALHQAVLALTREVEELKRRLGSGGRGGGRGTPPPTRPPSGRPRGGQRGHKGHTRTRPARIDETREHVATSCPRCGGAVEPSDESTERFEFEAAERALHILRHVLHRGWCPRCKCRVTPPAPRAPRLGLRPASARDALGAARHHGLHRGRPGDLQPYGVAMADVGRADRGDARSHRGGPGDDLLVDR